MNEIQLKTIKVMIAEGAIKVLDWVDGQVLFETTLFKVQYVMSQLYTVEMNNMVVTIVDSRHVQIRTEEVK